MAHRVLVTGIYRQRNADILRRMLEGIDAGRVRTALWALDAVAPSLESRTFGEGPGGKFELINRLLSLVPLVDSEYLAVADDDVSFTRGSLNRFVDVAAGGRLHLAQPAHDRRSHRSHEITRRRRFSKARQTTFVEIGPVFLVAPELRERVVPFPDGVGMGWGLELQWHDLHTAGARLGIVDAVAVRHHVPPGAGYDLEAERSANRERLKSRGWERMSDMQVTVQTWRPWQRKAPWAT